MTLSLKDLGQAFANAYSDKWVQQFNRQSVAALWGTPMAHSTCKCTHAPRKHLFVWGCYERDEEGRICRCRRQPWVSVKMRGTWLP
jgi:hypothetical protein